MYDTSYRVSKFFRQYGCPATIVLIAINVVAWFTVSTVPNGGPFAALAFIGFNFPRYFWTAVTWPLVTSGHPITLLFACAWCWWVCGSLERSWGTRSFVWFFAGVSGLTALTTWFGGQMLGVPAHLFGLWLSLGAPTVAWAALNRRETITLYFVLRIPAPLLALLSVVVVWYEVGPESGVPLLGLFALSGCAVAHWYAMHGRYLYHGAAPQTGVFGGMLSRRRGKVVRLPGSSRESTGPGLNPIRWFQSWQQRRKLDELWRKSQSSSPPDEDFRH